jgi:hypothetical protein
MLAMRLIDTAPAEQPVEQAGVLQANVLYLLVSVGLAVNAVAVVVGGELAVHGKL